MNETSLLTREAGSDPRSRIVVALRRRGSLSRAELARVTGLAKSTVSETVTELIVSGLVIETGPRPKPVGNRSGRPRRGLSLDPHAGACVGIDFGFRHARAIVADISHQVLASRQVHLGQDYTPDQGFAAAEELIAGVVADAAVAPERVIGVGVAVPGPVDPHSGTVVGTSMIPDWVGVNIVDELTARLGREVLVDNESNCAALSEYLWGAAQGATSMAYFKLHSGVGGAVILGGTVVRGIAGGAGEFGHISLDPGGPPCRCGNRGCLETFVGLPALLAQLRPHFDHDLTVREMLELAAGGDTECRRIIGHAADVVGRAAAAVGNALNPAVIVFGGALSEAGNVLLEPLRASFARNSLMARREDSATADARIVIGALGRNASALGAVGLVLTRLGESVQAAV